MGNFRKLFGLKTFVFLPYHKSTLPHYLQQVLEKQLSASHARHRDFEDAILSTEREKATLDRQVEATRKELETETNKRTALEKTVSSQKSEIATLKDRGVKLDRELNKALTDIKNLEWANKQLISKQDKTIVEHVHVLEEAKRVTDRQLAEARVELEKQTAYIKSLEKAKARLAGEAEDLARETERDKLESQRREKAARTQEERAARALAEVEAERRAREAAELQTRRLQSDLTSVKGRAEEMEDQLSHVQRAKENLEAELVRLAEETPGGGSSLAKMQRNYEARIASLEEQLHDADMANTTAAKIRDQVARQHAEIKKLIMSDAPRDEGFRQRLLRELESVDKQMEKEMKSRSRPRVSDVKPIANGDASKRSPSASSTRTRKVSEADAPSSDRQAHVLRQQLQVLELQIATSDRIRQHLESCLREMTVDLENSDGSKAYLEKTRGRLARENARLAELIEEEAATRRNTDSAQLKDVQAMWAQFKSTITREQESYSRLDESRKALVCTSNRNSLMRC
jgi:myosin heavy chain 9/10/11/14